jgi:hypothetical protein
MRAAITNAPDLAAAIAALDENSEELRATIASIYGEEAGSAFAMHWRHHTELYLDYVTATVNDNAAGQQAALDKLRTYRSTFTDFLADANPFLSAASFESLVSDHTDLLIQQADSYADGDYDAAYATQREAWAQIGTLSAGLAAAIAEQFPDVFPDAAVAVPSQPGSPGPAWPLLGLAAVLVAGLMGVRLATPLRARGAGRHGRGRPPRA